MCKFISFAIGIKEYNKGRIYFGRTFGSHEGIELANHNDLKPEEYRECEWTEDGLSVRVDGEESESEYKALILEKYADRENFIKGLPQQLIGYYSNGNKRSEWNYKDGKEHGKLVGWYENGMRRHEWNFKDGEFHGKCIEWEENGDKRYEFNYKDGKRQF